MLLARQNIQPGKCLAVLQHITGFNGFSTSPWCSLVWGQWCWFRFVLHGWTWIPGLIVGCILEWVWVWVCDSMVFHVHMAPIAMHLLYLRFCLSVVFSRCMYGVTCVAGIVYDRHSSDLTWVQLAPKYHSYGHTMPSMWKSLWCWDLTVSLVD